MPTRIGWTTFARVWRRRAGFGALHHAVQRMHPGTILLLLERGEDVNRAAPHGPHPIHLARFYEKPPSDAVLQIATTLIERGADPLVAWRGETPLQRAARKVRTLMKRVAKQRGVIP